MQYHTSYLDGNNKVIFTAYEFFETRNPFPLEGVDEYLRKKQDTLLHEYALCSNAREDEKMKFPDEVYEAYI